MAFSASINLSSSGERFFRPRLVFAVFTPCLLTGPKKKLRMRRQKKNVRSLPSAFIFHFPERQCFKAAPRRQRRGASRPTSASAAAAGRGRAPAPAPRRRRTRRQHSRRWRGDEYSFTEPHFSRIGLQILHYVLSLRIFTIAVGACILLSFHVHCHEVVRFHAFTFSFLSTYDTTLERI